MPIISIAEKIYQTNKINKRQRHRYEINKNYISEFEKNGLLFTADSDNGKRMQILLLREISIWHLYRASKIYL